MDNDNKNIESGGTNFMNNKFSKIIIAISSTLFVVSGILFGKSCFTPNILSQIGESKIYGAIDVPELDDCLSGWRDEWEWMVALETMGATSINYKEEYLKEEVSEILLGFYDDNDVSINIGVILSEPDNVIMVLEAVYDYERKELIYEPVYIVQGDWENLGNIEEYTDEKSIDEYLSRYGLTRKDVQKYQEYAIYKVVVKTWTKAHRQSYWLERWKLKRCTLVDNTFRFEEG